MYAAALKIVEKKGFVGNARTLLNMSNQNKTKTRVFMSNTRLSSN
jgi:hypothetical protein